jgi:competence protein ComEC
MTGASTPVVRAAVMASVFMLAHLIKREVDIYNSCAVAMILILGINPRHLFDIGFQLSFSSVISIVYLYPKIKSFLCPQALLKIKYMRYLIDGCLVSLSAWLGTMGFIACYFKIFSPITILANLFIVPLATLITLCGFSLIIISLVLPPAATFFASTCELLIKFLVYINTMLLNFPGAYIPLP